MTAGVSQGVPSLVEYHRVVASPAFESIARYSCRFLERNASLLRPYRDRWVADPLHQWSRRWEYPFVLQHVRDLAAPRLRILDAGSGLTFFPFYLADTVLASEVHCCDRDADLADLFERITGDHAGPHFQRADLADLPYPDAHFDLVYSVSVLEHTSGHDLISREIARVLRPGGRLIATFDVALEGRRDLPPLEADTLWRRLTCEISGTESKEPGVMDELRKECILTSNAIGEDDPELLPWSRRSWIRRAGATLLRRGGWRPYPHLTVFGGKTTRART
jgi:SAM-dependent methyltransferase